MPEQVDALELDSNIDTDNNEHYDEGPQLAVPNGDEYEFGNIELEDMVLSKGPYQIMQLILQKQVDDFMEEEITNTNDYVYWLKWVSDAEKRKQSIFESTSCVEIPILLQVHKAKSGDSHNNFNEELTLSDNHEVNIRWKKIYQKIRIDHNLDEEKRQQL
jgi:hypothetical protein